MGNTFVCDVVLNADHFSGLKYSFMCVYVCASPVRVTN